MIDHIDASCLSVLELAVVARRMWREIALVIARVTRREEREAIELGQLDLGGES